MMQIKRKKCTSKTSMNISPFLMEELQFPSPKNMFIFFLFLFMAVKLLKRWNSKKKLPPGPWRLPLIGNIHQLIGAPPPHQILHDLAKKHGPLMSLQLGETSNIVVSSPEIAKEVLITNGVVFAQRPHLIGPSIMAYGSKDIALSPNGSYWRQLRKIFMKKLMNAKQIQSFRSIREEEVSTLVKAVAAHEGYPFNLTEKIYSMTSGVTCKAAFGNEYRDQDSFVSLVREFSKLSSGLSLADAFPSLKLLQVITGLKQNFERLFNQSDTVIQGILDDHKEKMMVQVDFGVEGDQEDLVTTLLKLQKNGDPEFPFTDLEIKAVIWDTFSGGAETSSTAINWAMSELLKNPRIMEKAQREVRTVFDRKGHVDETCIREMKYLEAVIKETLRLHPPFTLSFPREGNAKCVINGYEVPDKTRVMVNLWAMGRDPDYWTEAETFMPERFLDSSIDFKGTNMEFIPFGAGRRICPGISFALASIELPLAQLLYHFNWNLPDGKKHEDLDMIEEFGITTTRKNDLILVPETYKHPCLE